MPSFEITEPGHQPVSVCIEKRWDANKAVVIGRIENKVIPIIVFKDPPQALSRMQFTCVSDGGKLWVRDGGPDIFQEKIREQILQGIFPWGIHEPTVDGLWKKSTYGTWLNSKALDPWGWEELILSDVLTFGRKLEYPVLAGYSVRYVPPSSHGTAGDMGTVSFSAVDVWRKESIRSKTEGTMLLGVIRKQHSNIAVIQEIDSTAELMFGHDPGKLQESEGTIALQDQFLYDQHPRLSGMIGDACSIDQAYVGRFTTTNGQEIGLTLRRRIINNEPPVLFGWVAMESKVIEPSTQQSWVSGALKLADSHPVAAVIVAICVAVIVIAIGL